MVCVFIGSESGRFLSINKVIAVIVSLFSSERGYLDLSLEPLKLHVRLCYEKSSASDTNDSCVRSFTQNASSRTSDTICPCDSSAMGPQ